jgi:hypothetical protein
MGEKRSAYRLLVGKPGGKRQLGRPRGKWVDNIRMDHGEMRWGGVDGIGVAPDMDRWRDFYFRGLNPVASIIFLRRRQSQQYFSNIFCYEYIPSGHLQVEYILVNS